MSRLIKEKVVSELSQRYQGLKNCICVNYQPLTALQATDLRAYLGEEGFKMDILKNTLAQRIFQQSDLMPIQEFLEGPTALVFVPSSEKSDDSVRLAKRLVTWRNKYKVLQIKGGLLEGNVVTPPQIRQIAALPSREVILSYLAATFNTPLSRLATSFKGLIKKLGYVLKALADKKKTDKPE